jgi:hypothetical protein
MDKEEKKLPSTMDKKCNANVTVSYSFPGVMLFMDRFQTIFMNSTAV